MSSPPLVRKRKRSDSDDGLIAQIASGSSPPISPPLITSNASSIPTTPMTPTTPITPHLTTPVSLPTTPRTTRLVHQPTTGLATAIPVREDSHAAVPLTSSLPSTDRQTHHNDASMEEGGGNDDGDDVSDVLSSSAHTTPTTTGGSRNNDIYRHRHTATSPLPPDTVLQLHLGPRQLQEFQAFIFHIKSSAAMSGFAPDGHKTTSKRRLVVSLGFDKTPNIDDDDRTVELCGFSPLKPFDELVTAICGQTHEWLHEPGNYYAVRVVVAPHMASGGTSILSMHSTTLVSGTLHTNRNDEVTPVPPSSSANIEDANVVSHPLSMPLALFDPFSVTKRATEDDQGDDNKEEVTTIATNSGSMLTVKTPILTIHSTEKKVAAVFTLDLNALYGLLQAVIKTAQASTLTSNQMVTLCFTPDKVNVSSQYLHANLAFDTAESTATALFGVATPETDLVEAIRIIAGDICRPYALLLYDCLTPSDITDKFPLVNSLMAPSAVSIQLFGTSKSRRYHSIAASAATSSSPNVATSNVLIVKPTHISLVLSDPNNVSLPSIVFNIGLRDTLPLNSDRHTYFPLSTPSTFNSRNLLAATTINSAFSGATGGDGFRRRGENSGNNGEPTHASDLHFAIGLPTDGGVLPKWPNTKKHTAHIILPSAETVPALDLTRENKVQNHSRALIVKSIKTSPVCYTQSAILLYPLLTEDDMNVQE